MRAHVAQFAGGWIIALVMLGAGRGQGSDSLAFVFARSIEGSSSGNGLIVGDGTLLLTARHVVFPARQQGMHRGEAMVTVLSPFLGDAAEAAVVAIDDQADLVLLRVPWKGHPALSLADEAQLLLAERLEIRAYAQAQGTLTAGAEKLLQQSLAVDQATLEVGGVTVRVGMSQNVVTRTVPPGPGWAGAPLCLAGTHRLAGVYSRTQAGGSAGSAVAVGRIRGLIAQAGASANTGPIVPQRTAPADAGQATLAYLRAAAASIGDDPRLALDHLQAFLKLRPASAVAQRDAAGQLRALDRLDDAQKAFARALELDPQLISARVLLGQLLDERIVPQAAEEHLRFAWDQGEGSTAAVLPLCNLLRRQNRNAECLPILEIAVQRNPLDGYLWSYLGQSRNTARDHAAAAAAFVRCAELMPENEPARAQAAEAFESAGQFARAEEQYRLLVAHHPASAAAHYRLARCVARDGARRDEALRTAQQALELADRPGAPPRSAIQSLIAAIRAARTSQGDEFHL